MHRLKIGATAGVLAVIGLGCFAGSLAARAADEAARGRILFLRCASCHDVSGSSINALYPGVRAASTFSQQSSSIILVRMHRATLILMKLSHQAQTPPTRS